jgi:type IV pilus assembly protein PilV
MALIEAMVGILIFAFGIIGLVGLQVAMTRAQGAAKYRADAVYLGSQAVGSMWADRANINQYNTGTCNAYAPCKDWADKVVTTLPAGTGQISVTPATGVVAITVSWSTSAEGTHSYVVSTSIN